MTDEIWKRKETESPCIKVCVTHPDSGLCMGCFRTRDEIARWSRMTPEERRSVMETLAQRAPQVKGKRRGGRLRQKG